MTALSPAEIQKALKSRPDWKRRGKIITRTFELRNFADAMRFVNAVALEAERANHHPDIDIRWNQVTLALTSHDAGGLTVRDFDAADAYDRIAK